MFLILLFLQKTGGLMQLFGKKSSLKSSSNIFKEIFDKAEVFNSYALLLTDESKKVLHVNDEFLKVFQYDITEIIGQETNYINSGQHQSSFYNEIWSTLKNGQTFSDYINTMRKDGIVIRSRIKAIPIKLGNGLIKYLVIYDPIEKETSFNLDVSESYKILLEIIEKIPDIVCIKDGEGKWLLANEADLNLFQLNGVSYQGKTDADLAEFTHDLYKNAFLTCMQSDELCWQKASLNRSDEVILIPDGDEVVLDVLKIPVFHKDGSRKSLIVIGRDVTEQRSAEKGLKKALNKAEESDRLKSTFLATMSHELRTPLNSVLGFSSLISEEEDLFEIYDFARIINNNGQMLLNLIEDLFDISLIESDQMQISKEEVDIVKVVNEVYEIFPVEINFLNKFNLEFSKEIQFDKLMVYTDGFRVKQILTNLLRNALKFTHEGHIKVILERKDNNIIISVDDSGIGIEQEKIDAIFHVFVQGEAGLSRKFGGAGLGLAISKKMAFLLGGDLYATSEIGKGSRFSFHFPMNE